MSIAPEILEHLQQQAARSDSPNSWECYAVVLQYASEALQRIPTREALEACNNDEIDHILEAELEHLASAVHKIFPGMGPEELAYYLRV